MYHVNTEDSKDALLQRIFKSRRISKTSLTVIHTIPGYTAFATSMLYENWDHKSMGFPKTPFFNYAFGVQRKSKCITYMAQVYHKAAIAHGLRH